MDTQLEVAQILVWMQRLDWCEGGMNISWHRQIDIFSLITLETIIKKRAD